MIKFLAVSLLLLFSSPLFADSIDYSKLFQDKVGCFILYDIKQHKVVSQYNPSQFCKERITPASTFKVPLSLMAFDQHLITQQTIFKWDKKPYDMPGWNQDQTPATWEQYSVLWVSQALTPRLGIKKIKEYLQKFNYGNEDFTGDPMKNNGLTHAWLSSSLKISANEQLEFMKRFVTFKLPVSHQAINNTKENIYLGTYPTGYSLYGKTGTGIPPQNNPSGKLREGWFVGLIEKSNQRYVFVLNFRDLTVPQTAQYAGPRAKAMAIDILSQMGFLNKNN